MELTNFLEVIELVVHSEFDIDFENERLAMYCGDNVRHLFDEVEFKHSEFIISGYELSYGHGEIELSTGIKITVILNKYVDGVKLYRHNRNVNPGLIGKDYAIGAGQMLLHVATEYFKYHGYIK